MMTPEDIRRLESEGCVFPTLQTQLQKEELYVHTAQAIASHQPPCPDIAREVLDEVDAMSWLRQTAKEAIHVILDPVAAPKILKFPVQGDSLPPAA